MKILFLTIATAVFLLHACMRKTYPDLGESIFRTGRNLEGKSLLDKKRSQIRLAKSCQACHGKNGTGVQGCDIRWSNLSRLPVPYNDTLFFRLLDQDLKSDGSQARMGVHWDLTEQEKQGLLAFLKTL
jgi:cytochrome c553